VRRKAAALPASPVAAKETEHNINKHTNNVAMCFFFKL
jgi:hypothetical protein